MISQTSQATTVSKISVFAEALREWTVSARNSIPVKKGLGVVDVNVLYHSLLGMASPEQALGSLVRDADVSSK
jgi:hypothetical protein